MKHLILILTCFCYSLVSAQNNPEPLQVVFYNVENLFDLQDDSGKQDHEWLDGAYKKWDQDRYEKKLWDLERVIREAGGGRCPDIIGLCEVENLNVLEDLALQLRSTAGIDFELGIAHIEGPDERGIDVALLYRQENFRVDSMRSIKVQLDSADNEKTRDILKVSGMAWDKPIYIYVNHWPSRSGGLSKTEPNRLIAAGVLKKEVEKQLKLDPTSRILMMGDFNDEPENKSMSEILMGIGFSGKQDLENLMIPLDERGRGTYRYKANWNMLDQFVVSNDFLSQKKVFIDPKSVRIVSAPWMLYEDAKYGFKPSKTYGGPNYYGGYSDHLPIYLEIRFR